MPNKQSLQHKNIAFISLISTFFSLATSTALIPMVIMSTFVSATLRVASII